MAETFVAERRGPGEFVQRVCLKRIRADLANDPELVRQFMAEAAIAARLRHATIASVLDFGEDDGVLYMAIELIDGVDLRELIHSSPSGLPAALVLYIGIELCTALDIAHGAQGGAVVHRDVSPSNVLVSREGEVKLADFGIARTEAGPVHTRTGIVRGKVPYMAPEYARTGRFDVRADLFSLGVLLHECAYGVRPFDGATDLETLERAMRGERIAVPARKEPLPESFESILTHLLHADPDQRFDRAGAALEALLALPSGPRARRDLGARVSALLPGRQDADSYASTALAAVAARHDASAVTRTLESELVVPKRRVGPWVALTLAACALGLAVAMWLQRAPAIANDAGSVKPTQDGTGTGAASAEPARAPAVEQAPKPPSDPVLRPVAEASAPPPSEVEPARVEVIVVPWGRVFVNDAPAGTAPTTLKLAPGTYNIRVEGPNGTDRRRVELSAGEHRRIRFR